MIEANDFKPAAPSPGETRLIEEIEKEDETLRKQPSGPTWTQWWVPLVAIALVLSCQYLYWKALGTKLPQGARSSSAEGADAQLLSLAGSFGDQFGGFTAIITAATLGLMAYSLMLQRFELRLQRIELMRQRAEAMAQNRHLDAQAKHLAHQVVEMAEERTYREQPVLVTVGTTWALTSNGMVRVQGTISNMTDYHAWRIRIRAVLYQGKRHQIRRIRGEGHLASNHQMQFSVDFDPSHFPHAHWTGTQQKSRPFFGLAVHYRNLTGGTLATWQTLRLAIGDGRTAPDSSPQGDLARPATLALFRIASGSRATDMDPEKLAAGDFTFDEHEERDTDEVQGA